MVTVLVINNEKLYKMNLFYETLIQLLTVRTFKIPLIILSRRGNTIYRNKYVKHLYDNASSKLSIESFVERYLKEFILFQKRQFPISFSFSLGGENFRVIYSKVKFPRLMIALIHYEGKKDSLFKQEITRNISHELKTPLTSIRGYIETIMGNPLMNVEDRRYFLDRALKNVERLENLIRDLTLLDMASDGSRFLNKKEINLSQIIFNSKKNLEFKAEKHGVKITLKNIPEKIPITGHSLLLEAIFLNLIENGVKYSRPGDTITVEYINNGNTGHTIAVYDTGPGIPEEYHLKVFERFFRIDSGRSRKTGGTGLGLSIVKHAVKFHNGSIHIDKDYTNGTKFILYFPPSEFKG